MRKRTGEANGGAAASFRILSPGDFRPRFYDPFFLTVCEPSKASSKKTVTCENVLLKHLGNFPPPCILKGREYRIVRMTTLVEHMEAFYFQNILFSNNMS